MKKFIGFAILLILLFPNVQAKALYDNELKIKYDFYKDEEINIRETFYAGKNFKSENTKRYIPRKQGSTIKINSISIDYHDNKINEKYKEQNGVKRYAIVESEDYFELEIESFNESNIDSIKIDYSLVRAYERGTDTVFYKGEIYSPLNTIKPSKVEVDFSKFDLAGLWIVSGKEIGGDSPYANGVRLTFDGNENISLIAAVDSYSVKRVPVTIEEDVVQNFNTLYKAVDINVPANEEYESNFPFGLSKTRSTLLIMSVVAVILYIAILSIREKIKGKKTNKISKSKYNNKGFVNIDNLLREIEPVSKVSPLLIACLFNKDNETILKVKILELLRNEYLKVDSKGNITIVDEINVDDEFINLLKTESEVTLKSLLNNAYSPSYSKIVDSYRKELSDLAGKGINLKESYKKEMKKKGILSSEWISLRDKLISFRGNYEMCISTEKLINIVIYAIALGTTKSKLPNVDKNINKADKRNEFFKQVKSLGLI